MREHETDKRPGGEFEFMVPLSEIYRFNGPEAAKDLVKAHKESPPKRADMHPAKRFIVSSVGIFFLMIGLMGLCSEGSNPMTMIFLAAGLAIIWFFLARPEKEKRKDRADGQKVQEVSVSFNENDITVRSRRYELKREWRELIEHKKTKKGVHLYFIDGTVNWLPAGCFDGADEMNGLVELLQKKTTNDQR